MRSLQVHQSKSLIFKILSKEVSQKLKFTKFFFPTAFPSYLRKMIEVLRVGLGPHRHSVHLVVEPIQKKAKKLLSILLTESKEKRGSNTSHSKSQPAMAGTHPREDTSARLLLIANEAWRISLDLGLELRGAHHIIGG